MTKLLILALALLSFSTFSACDPQTGAVAVPFQQERSSCFVPKSALAIKSIENEFELSLMEHETKNIPAVTTPHFVVLDSDGNGRSPVIQIAAFLCSGEIPITAEAIRVNLANLKDLQNGGVIVSTGSVADTNLNQELKNRAKIFDKFGFVYEFKADELLEDDRENVFIPAIFTNSVTPQTALEKKILSFFLTRTASSINGCAAKFKTVMRDQLFENILERLSGSGILIKKKLLSKKYSITWN